MPEMSSPDDKSGYQSPQQDETLQHPSQNGMGWLLPFLLLVLGTALVLYFIKGNKKNEVPGLVSTDGVIADTLNTTGPAATRDSPFQRKPLSIRINDTTEISAFQNGVEKQLLIYLSSKEPADSISKNRWFDFDDLNFRSGSAELTDSSMHQVQNIVTILEAYPKVKIKIGGYNDKTGDDAANMKLSQARADAVLNALIQSGANPKQLVAAEGYGSDFAKAAIDAPDSLKVKDRRISINVRAK